MDQQRVILVLAISTISTSEPLLKLLSYLMPSLDQVVNASLHMALLTANLLYYLLSVAVVLSCVAIVVPMMLSIQWSSLCSSKPPKIDHANGLPRRSEGIPAIKAIRSL